MLKPFFFLYFLKRLFRNAKINLKKKIVIVKKKKRCKFTELKKIINVKITLLRLYSIYLHIS